MSLLRTALLVTAAVLLMCGAAAAGYLVGTRSVPDKHDALVAQQHAKRVAIERQSRQALGGGKRSGLEQGREAGRRAAMRAGRVRGLRAGTIAATRATSTRTVRAPIQPATRGPALSGTGGVLVVGDSLEVLTSPYLKKYLPGVHLTINAVGGYNSLQIYDLFRESYDPSQSVVVFDAGTNDNPSYPEILAGRLQAVADIVGHRCMVVPTIHGLNVGGVNSDGKNRVVARFAASRPGTVTPDWAGFVATHPELMQPDNLHPGLEGADRRAALIAEGVRQCALSGFGL